MLARLRPLGHLWVIFLIGHAFMKIGLIGYQGSGKSTLFEWLTGVAPDPAVATPAKARWPRCPSRAVEPLCGDLPPQEGHAAPSLELVDTPGLSRTHEGNAARLALIREAGCLVLVVRAFDRQRPGSRTPPLSTRTCCWPTWRSSRAASIGCADSVKKPRPNREQELAELAALEHVLAAMEAGKPLAESAHDRGAAQSHPQFRLLTEKPRLVVVNVGRRRGRPERFGPRSSARRRRAGAGRAGRAGAGTGADDARGASASSSARWA